MDPAHAELGDARPRGRGASDEPGSGPSLRCPCCGGLFPLDYRVCPRDASPLGVAEEACDPLLGAVLAGAYRIRRLRSRGGMSRIYDAEHVRLGRPLVAKVMHEELVARPEAVARFEREARAASSIDSPHVASVVDALQTPDGRPTLVVEALEGEDLQERLDREPTLSAEVAVRIALAMCRGLARAHALGIVHRDVKPSNVFLARSADGREVVKLLDFGVAKLGEGADLTRTGAVVGTPAFMAPEQARGAARVDARADVYGVGAVLYRMVTGAPPYAGSDATAVLGRLLHREPRRPRDLEPSVPLALEAVIQRAMARDVAARFASVEALSAALAALLPPAEEESSSGGASAASTVATLERTARRARPLAFLGGVCLALFAFAWTSLALDGYLAGSLASPRVARGLALGVALVAAWLWWRHVRPRWPNGPAVAASGARLGRALGAGLLAHGGLSLLAGALAASGGSEPWPSPRGVLVATAAVGLAAWARPRRG